MELSGPLKTDGSFISFHIPPTPESSKGLYRPPNYSRTRACAKSGNTTLPQFAPTLYVGNDGNFAGRLTGSYDLLLSQRWIVQPEAELNFYNKDDPGRRIGSGLSDLDAGVRLRYEVRRKFGPYIGFAYNGTYGNTANYSRQGGESTGNPRFVFGLRLWY